MLDKVRIKNFEMLNELESNYQSLEKKIFRLLQRHKDLEDRYLELSDKYSKMKGKYEAALEEAEILKEEQKKIMLVSAISGNPDHNRLMKNHINRLVKEIDTCIAQLHNSGL